MDGREEELVEVDDLFGFGLAFTFGTGETLGIGDGL